MLTRETQGDGYSFAARRLRFSTQRFHSRKRAWDLHAKLNSRSRSIAGLRCSLSLNRATSIRVLAPSRDFDARSHSIASFDAHSRSIAGFRFSFSLHRRTSIIVLAPSRDFDAHSRSIATPQCRVLAPSRDFCCRDIIARTMSYT